MLPYNFNLNSFNLMIGSWNPYRTGANTEFPNPLVSLWIHMQQTYLDIQHVCILVRMHRFG